VAKQVKTHAMRVLDAKGVAYRATEYDPSGAFHPADEAARLLGLPPDAVYKTLVVLRDGAASANPMLVLVPAAAQVDLKLLAGATGAKKLRMATQREAEQLTGMQVGGISALGLRNPAAFEVLIDESARGRDRISISAGQRGVEIELAVADFVTLTAARFVRAT
jgi:Cys-tRNA(Pro)/Cys-tRNA(Cys) deacylase